MRSLPEVALARYRLEKASDNLAAARDALSLGHYANAVGQSYYCIFTAMRSLLALKKLISEAKVVREKADYVDFFKASKEVAVRHIANAELFLKLKSF